MHLAFTMAPGRGDTDLILFRLAARLAARGLRCRGIVQINSDRGDSGPCDMDVRVLPEGRILRISQALGQSARGCRLDPSALETAAGLVSASLAEGADILIVNKFGKHEAEGRGFRSIIADAIGLGLPVLVGVNSLNLPAFQSFAEGCARQIAPDIDSLEDWALFATGAQIPAA